MFGPKDQPRFRHPDDKRRLSEVKHDMRLLQFNALLAGNRDSMESMTSAEALADDPNRYTSGAGQIMESQDAQNSAREKPLNIMDGGKVEVLNSGRR